MVVVIKRGSSRKSIEAALKKLPRRRGIDAKKYSGVLKLKEDPRDIQKQLRDEWE